MRRNRQLVRWRVAKNQYYRLRPWSATLWDYTLTMPGPVFMETRHFFFFKNALKFALSQEAEDIRSNYTKFRR